ncbi:hypothetical protein [Maridesulfovibrio sp.]|uniref:hypothetical protein n=1 Tax=Maridesulfovibrio sp. TaxID=2795000 RepID=UPI0039EF8546
MSQASKLEAAPINGKIRGCTIVLRTFVQPLDDDDFERLSKVIAVLDGCIEHMDDFRQQEVTIGKIRNCIYELRSFSKPLKDEDFEKLSGVITLLEECVLHLEELEQQTPVKEYTPPLDSTKLANELAARMEG